MGMSASQARLLYLTAQMNNLSLKGQQVSDAKIRLTMDTEAVQEKYIEALNSTRLFVNNNIFTVSGGATTTSEYITLENLQAKGLKVTDGTKVLGYRYKEVMSGKTEKILIGYENDYDNPIYPKKEVKIDGLQPPSPNASGNIVQMQSIIDSTGLGAEDLEVKSYSTSINGKEVQLNSIAIHSQKGFEALYEMMCKEGANGDIDNSLKQNYILDTDIDMSKYNNNGIAFFQGTFDGNGHTISGLHGTQGLFRDVYGIVKSVNIDGANISAETDAIGGVAGYLGEGGLIEGCNVTNLNLTCTLQNNKDYGNAAYKSERCGVGGVVGYNYGSIRNTSAQGTVSIPYADDSFGFIGGFVGVNVNPEYGADDNVIENCYSDVNIKLGAGANYSNSINAFIGDDSYESIVKNCISMGKITTASGGKINGQDLANWGPVIESNLTNVMALDTRVNQGVLYWSQENNPNFGNGSTSQPSSLTSAKEITADGSIPIWLTSGEEGYDEQNENSCQKNNLPVINLTGLQEAGLTFNGVKYVDDTDQEPIGYKQKPIYQEVETKVTELVEDPTFKISSLELEEGLRSGAYQLIKEAEKETTQTISINGLFFEVQGLSTCTEIVDKIEEGKAQKAEAEYNKAMQEIQIKDKRYELDQKKIDTEYNALVQEEDSLKNVINKNIDRSFKAFG